MKDKPGITESKPVEILSTEEAFGLVHIKGGHVITLRAKIVGIDQLFVDGVPAKDEDGVLQFDSKLDITIKVYAENHRGH